MLPANLTGIVLDDKYRIERELGRGGMGAVYLATHVGTERPVAVKVITPQFTGKDEFVERFRREARAAGRLRHPNVVDVTDFGFARVDGESVAYLVMEYLDGCSLAEILAEENSLPLTWVVDILEQVSGAVDEAHKKGIVHRDLKPDNIWLEPNRRGGYTVKVLDFGLAKLAERLPGLPPTSGGGLGSLAAQSTRVASPATSPMMGRNTELPTEGLTQVPLASDVESLVTTQILPPPPAGGVTVQEAPSASSIAPSASSIESFTTGQVTGLRGEISDAEDSTTQILPAVPGVTEHKDGIQSLKSQVESEDLKTMALPAATKRDGAAMLTEPADGLTRVGSILGTPLYMSPEQCSGQPLDYRTDIYSLGVIAYQMLTGQTPFSGNSFDVIKKHTEAAPISIRKLRRKVPRQMARTVMWALEKDPAKRIDSAAGFGSAMRASLDTTGVLLRRGFALFSEHFTKLFVVSLVTQLPLIVLASARLASSIVRYSHGVHKEDPRLAGAFGLALLVLTFFSSPVIIGVTIRLVTQLYVAPLRPLSLRSAILAVKNRFWALIYTTFIYAMGSLLGLILLVIPGILFYFNGSLAAPVVIMEGSKGLKAIRRSKVLVKRSRPTVIAIILIQYLIPSLASSITLTIIMAAFKEIKGGQAMLVGSFSGLMSNLFNVLIIPLISVLTALLYLKTRMVGGEVLKDMLNEFEEQDAPKTKWQARMKSTVYSASK